MQKSRPVVGIIVNERIIGNMPSYVVACKYVTPVIEIAQAAPILLPPLADQSSISQWLAIMDGLILTGSSSDVHPSHYGDVIKNPKSYFDSNRDYISLNLVKQAVTHGLPILGICRGFQEINVALGGSLHQSVHQVEHFFDHREPESDDIHVSYGHKHIVTTVADGKLREIVNNVAQFPVNSLHDQGVDRLADVLQAEAHAEDGLIEAFSLKESKQFLLATQWHVEWQPRQDNCSLAIWRAFGNACIKYHESKLKEYA